MTTSTGALAPPWFVAITAAVPAGVRGGTCTKTSCADGPRAASATACATATACAAATKPTNGHAEPRTARPEAGCGSGRIEVVRRIGRVLAHQHDARGLDAGDGHRQVRADGIGKAELKDLPDRGDTVAGLVLHARDHGRWGRLMIGAAREQRAGGEPADAETYGDDWEAPAPPHVSCPARR